MSQELMVGFHVFGCNSQHKVIGASHLVTFHDLRELGDFFFKFA